MRSLLTWVWIGWGVYFAIAEGYALWTSYKGDTLSEHAWLYLRRTALLRAAMGALLGWLVWHMLLYQGQGYGWQDAVAIAGGVLLGLIGGPWRPGVEVEVLRAQKAVA